MEPREVNVLKQIVFVKWDTSDGVFSTGTTFDETKFSPYFIFCFMNRGTMIEIQKTKPFFHSDTISFSLSISRTYDAFAEIFS